MNCVRCVTTWPSTFPGVLEPDTEVASVTGRNVSHGPFLLESRSLDNATRFVALALVDFVAVSLAGCLVAPWALGAPEIWTWDRTRPQLTGAFASHLTARV